MDHSAHYGAEPLLRFAARCYGVSSDALEPLPGGHFARVYAFARDGHDYVLRVTPPNEEITLKSMRVVLGWLGYLAAHGGAVSAPLPSRAGRLVEVYDGAAGPSLLTAFERAPGVLAQELTANQWTPRLCHRLGRAVGRMHALAGRYTAATACARPTWEDVGNCFRPSAELDASQRAVEERGEATLAHIRQLSTDPVGYGLVHVDLHLGNVYVQPEQARITILDFDDCCYGWYVMDTAMLLFDVVVLYGGPDPDALARRFLRPYLHGYTSERPLRRAWLRQLPAFLKALEYGVYTQLYPHYRPETADGWTARLMAGRRRRIEDGPPYVNLDLSALERALQ